MEFSKAILVKRFQRIPFQKGDLGVFASTHYSVAIFSKKQSQRGLYNKSVSLHYNVKSVYDMAANFDGIMYDTALRKIREGSVFL